jgi:hypothetical protein
MIEATYVLTIDDLMEAGKKGYGDDLSITRFRMQWLAIGIGLIHCAYPETISTLLADVAWNAFHLDRHSLPRSTFERSFSEKRDKRTDRCSDRRSWRDDSVFNQSERD